jgi:hypothetical protein
MLIAGATKRTGAIKERGQYENHARFWSCRVVHRPDGHRLRVRTICSANAHHKNPRHRDPECRAILPKEVRETVSLYLDGKIDQWYSLQGRPGVAFILNVTDPAAAHEMLEKLPLGQAHLMSFELIPLAPLNPLRQLQGMTSGSP